MSLSDILKKVSKFHPCTIDKLMLEYVALVLVKHGGNKEAVALELDITEATVYNYIRRMGPAACDKYIRKPRPKVIKPPKPPKPPKEPPPPKPLKSNKFKFEKTFNVNYTCPSCGKPIKGAELNVVVTTVIRTGKCQHCKKALQVCWAGDNHYQYQGQGVMRRLNLQE